MHESLRVLNLEDNADDTFLLRRHLTRGGYELTLRREDTRQGFESALRENSWDVILADYFLPGFTALDALRIVRAHGADIPFIVVSGAVGEQAAVDVLREGAADYVMKDSLGRLLPAIERELEKATESRRHRAAQVALRESEMRLRGILANSPNAVFMKDTQGRYVLVNRCYRDLLGLDESEICGKTDHDLFPAEFAAVYCENEQKVAALKAPMQFEETVPVGNAIYTRLANRFPLLDPTAELEGICSICTDITERKRSEETMRRTEKLAAAGRLAASIAHEINNPLEALMNLMYLLRSRPNLDSTAKNLLDSAEQELKRVSHIARQSLAFYRESTKPTVFDISELLNTVLELYGYKLRQRDIELKFEPCSQCMIRAWEGEIRQVFSNFVANAIDACSAGGRVRVRVRQVHGGSGLVGVRIVVSDTGCGIPKENLAKVFDAFFTTKTDGTGTGLGLWVAQNILDKHKATLRVRSSVTPRRCGTVVSVFLPACHDSDALQQADRTAMAV